MPAQATAVLSASYRMSVDLGRIYMKQSGSASGRRREALERVLLYQVASSSVGHLGNYERDTDMKYGKNKE